MATTFKTFKALHTARDLFILPNAWDAASAAILQENNYAAVGTSSAAVATALGYEDGEAMPFAEYLMIIKRIAASVNIPVTVDMEMGYGKTKEVIHTNLQKLVDAGVAGINIEDSFITHGKRSLGEPKEFADTLSFLKSKVKDTLFINARCDTYLLHVKDKESETVNRLKLYQSAGADGIFLPFMKEEQDITHALAATKLPLNLMAIPGLPDLDTLQQLGVKRVSMGPFLQKKTYSKANELAKKVMEQKSIKPIL